MQKGLLFKRKRCFMTQDKIKRVHRFYSWGLAAILVIVGILMILSCLDIYNSGPRAYSAETITLHFQRIAIPVYIAIAGIIGGIALNLFLPFPSQRAKSLITAQESMLRMQQKVSIPPVQKEIRMRLVLRVITAVIFTGLMIYPAIYYLQPGHFTVEHLNNNVIRAVTITMIPATVGLALCWGCQLLLNASYRRETAIYKQALVDGQRVVKSPIEDVKCCRGLHWLRIALAAVAAIFIIVGIFNGGAEDVLKKAIAICTECIGLG